MIDPVFLFLAMSLIQGYSSSEDDDQVEEEHVQDLGEDELVRNTFTSLPAPSSKINKKQLPLLDELEVFEDDDDDDDSDSGPDNDKKLAEKHVVPNAEYEVQTEQFVATNFEHTNVKRQRFVDVDDEDDEGDIRNIVSTKLLSSKYDNTTKVENSIATTTTTTSDTRFRSTATEGGATTNNMGFRQPLNREMAEELRSASKSNSQFVELSSRELRQDAVKYQQGGITSNLYKSRGVSGRQNQISVLAKVAAKQREEKS